MRVRARRRWRRIGRALAAMSLVLAVVVAMAPVTVGASSCGSVVVRESPAASDAASASAIDGACGRAVAKRGWAAVGLGAVAVLLATGVTLSRRRAQLRYEAWRTGRPQEPTLHSVTVTD